MASSDSWGDMAVVARRPVLRMIVPSFFDRINVDCTPGFAANRERFSRVDAGWTKVNS